MNRRRLIRHSKPGSGTHRHEILNETNSQRVMAEFIAWADKMVAAQS